MDNVTRYTVKFPLGDFVQFYCALVAFVITSLLGMGVAFLMLGLAFWKAADLGHRTKAEAQND